MHSLYRLYEGSLGQIQTDIPPLEAALREAVDNRQGETVVVRAAATIGHIVAATAALRESGEDPNGLMGAERDAIGIMLLGDNSVIPVIDGQLRYEGPPDTNPDWRVAILLATRHASEVLAAIQPPEQQEATPVQL